jgi:hypothetical protein
LLLYLCGWLCGDSPIGKSYVTAIPKKSGCDEFNCLRDTNDPLLYSSLLFFGVRARGLALRVAIAIAIYTKASFNIPFIL